MSNRLNLTVVTPEREVISKEVDEITAPGWDGEFGVLPDHAPLLALIRSGELSYRVDDEVEAIAVGFGFVEVLPDKVTVLIESAESPDEINIDRAVQARDRAMEKLQGAAGADVDFERARAALMRAISRLEIAKKLKTGRRQAERQFGPNR